MLEEAAYLDERVFFSVVVPLLELKYALMFAISTPADEYNYYSKLTRLIDPQTGEPVFNVIHKTLVCKACRKNGLADDCKHMQAARPEWKNESVALIRLVMGVRKDDFEREIGAEITNGQNNAFSPQLIRELFEAPAVREKIKNSPCIYVGIDTSGDTPSPVSEFSMMSVIFDDRTNRFLVRNEWSGVLCV